jgi:hypothetical protein
VGVQQFAVTAVRTGIAGHGRTVIPVPPPGHFTRWCSC